MWRGDFARYALRVWTGTYYAIDAWTWRPDDDPTDKNYRRESDNRAHYEAARNATASSSAHASTSATDYTAVALVLGSVVVLLLGCCACCYWASYGWHYSKGRRPLPYTGGASQPDLADASTATEGRRCPSPTDTELSAYAEQHFDPPMPVAAEGRRPISMLATINEPER